jgi:hypothetical protein
LRIFPKTFYIKMLYVFDEFSFFIYLSGMVHNQGNTFKIIQK